MVFAVQITKRIWWNSKHECALRLFFRCSWRSECDDFTRSQWAFRDPILDLWKDTWWVCLYPVSSCLSLTVRFLVLSSTSWKSVTPQLLAFGFVICTFNPEKKIEPHPLPVSPCKALISFQMHFTALRRSFLQALQLDRDNEIINRKCNHHHPQQYHLVLGLALHTFKRFAGTWGAMADFPLILRTIGNFLFVGTSFLWIQWLGVRLAEE